MNKLDFGMIRALPKRVGVKICGFLIRGISLGLVVTFFAPRGQERGTGGMEAGDIFIY